MKKIFRHYSSWLLFIGIAVSFTAAVNGKQVYERVEKALMELNEYKYLNNYIINISGIDNIQEIVDDIEILNGNVSIAGNDIYINDADVYQHTEILIKQDVDMPYPVRKVSDSDGIILGKGMEQYCYSKDDGKAQYIVIDGKEYQVEGYIESTYSDALNGKVILRTDNPKEISCLENADTLVLNYGSYSVDAEDCVRKFSGQFGEKYSIYCEEESDKYVEVGSANAKEEFYKTITLFAMINCVVISEFWIMRRKQEIIIRKLWGYGNIRLFWILYREILIIAGLAVGMAIVLQNVAALFHPYTYGFQWMERVIFSLIFIVVSAVAVVIIPLYKASHYRASEGLE
ncbi:MAG: ABC transporter permease [Lachnospiraceae bacterium]